MANAENSIASWPTGPQELPLSLRALLSRYNPRLIKGVFLSRRFPSATPETVSAKQCQNRKGISIVELIHFHQCDTRSVIRAAHDRGIGTGRQSRTDR